MAEGLKFYKASYKRLSHIDHAILHDPVAVYYVLYPEEFTV